MRAAAGREWDGSRGGSDGKERREGRGKNAVCASTEHNDTSKKTQEMVEECAEGRQRGYDDEASYVQFGSRRVYLTAVSILLRAQRLCTYAHNKRRCSGWAVVIYYDGNSFMVPPQSHWLLFGR